MKSHNAGLDILGGDGGHVVGHGGHGGRGRGGGWGWPDVDDGDDDDAPVINNYYLVEDRDDLLGMFDFNVEQPKMDSLKQVTVSIAQSLLAAGQTAINGAIAGAKQPWYKSDLPGNNSRNLVASKLQWHANTLAPLANTPNAMYASGDDLKAVVLSAFREANAVEEGAAYLQTAWDAMWSEIATKIAALPVEVAKVVGKVVDKVSPSWLKWGLGAGVGVLVLVGGLVAYKKLRAVTP